ncbi:MAG: TOBE domain-containing protein [Candidatus Helarchaeota archaeon]
MKISARNKLQTIITAIQKEGLISTLQLSLTKPTIVTAVITQSAAEEMAITKGDPIKIVVKPTEIFIQVPEKKE